MTTRMIWLTDVAVGIGIGLIIFTIAVIGITWYTALAVCAFIIHLIIRWCETASVLPKWARKYF